MLSKLVLALLKITTVNYAELALIMPPLVQVSSNFKCIQRFMKQYSFCTHCFVQFAWLLYGDKGDWVALSMDRTNWKFGGVNITILTIGLCWRGTAILLV